MMAQATARWVAFLGLALLAAFIIFDFAAAEDINQKQIALGRSVYDAHCARCHGKNLEGQPDWQTRLPNGRLPAPPHDASGHTWHHPDKVLLGITRNGLKPYAGEDYESDMPAFAGMLRDAEIEAIIAYIKSTWPEREREYQERVNRNSPAGQ
jgi:mono/diheme cytochrome c family protein